MAVEFLAKVELSRLNGAFVADGQNNYQGQKLLVIPVEEAKLYTNQKTGVISLDLMVNRRNSVGQYGDTHFFAQSLPKEYREQMGEEYVKQHFPIIGNMKPHGSQSQQPQSQPFTGGNEYQQSAANFQNPAPAVGNKDLPF